MAIPCPALHAASGTCGSRAQLTGWLLSSFYTAVCKKRAAALAGFPLAAKVIRSGICRARVSLA
jgi:hypothetical protein